MPRTTIKQISSEVNLSPPSVTERIRRLEESGAILGYHAKVNPLKAVKKFDGIYRSGCHSPSDMLPFLLSVALSSCILEHYRVIGIYNAMLLAALHDTSELETLIDSLKKYGSTNSFIILSTVFEGRTPKELNQN